MFRPKVRPWVSVPFDPFPGDEADVGGALEGDADGVDTVR